MTNNKIKNSDSTLELIATLRGHKNLIHDLTWDPDGLTLASASEDHLIILWDPLSGKPCRVLDGHQNGVLCLAWSHNRQYLASGDRNAVINIRDNIDNTGWELNGHTKPITRLIWEKNQVLLASISKGCSIRIWDIQTRAEVMKIIVDDPICDIAWLSEDNLLVSFSGMAMIYCLNRLTKRITKYPVANTEVISGTYRLPNGNLTANPPHGPIDFSDTYMKLKIKGIIAQDGPLQSLHPSQKHPLLATTSKSGILLLWQTDTWTKKTFFRNSIDQIPNQVFEFHPRWPVFACLADEDNVIQIWKVITK